MGSGYSIEQKQEFEIYRLQINKAIKDSDHYVDFRYVRNSLARQLEMRQPWS